MIPAPYELKRITWDTADTFTIELQPLGPAAPCSGLPGQFNMLYAFGVGEIPISISGISECGQRWVHTVRQVGAVSHALGRLSPGDRVGVRGPFGTPWPVLAAMNHDVILVAGGIGLAPLRPVVNVLIEDRSKYQHVSVLYGARTPADMLYCDELEQWGGRFDLDVATSVDQGATEWRGNVGVITTLVPHVVCEPERTVAMVCGPEIMMRFAVMALESRGVPSNQIYLSMERNMKCAVGFCGHCQFGADFICKDGPVFCYSEIQDRITVKEV
jgi:NAD(P)H-flavin reductase